MTLSALIAVLVVLVVLGFVLYLVNKLIPMDATIKLIINFVVVLAVVMWLLSFFGIFHLGR